MSLIKGIEVDLEVSHAVGIASTREKRASAHYVILVAVWTVCPADVFSSERH